MFGLFSAKALATTSVLLFLAPLVLSCGRMAAKPEALASSPMTIADGRQRKIFANWTPGQTAAGDCQGRNARLILYSDGSREWQVELMSKDPGENWAQSFHFYDAANPDATWFGSRDGGRFKIYDENVWTYWRYGRGPADKKLAEAFDRISYVVWSASCYS